MSDPLKIGGLLAIMLLGATAMGVAVLLARDPELLKRLVKQGALTYHRAASLLAEVREELGDVMAEALHQAEEELRQADIEAAATAASQGRQAGGEA
jgi:glutamine synthetase adenylyltransferase